MKVRDIFEAQTREVDLKAWHPGIKRAAITKGEGSEPSSLFYDWGWGNDTITQKGEESYDDFRQRTKREVMAQMQRADMFGSKPRQSNRNPATTLAQPGSAASGPTTPSAPEGAVHLNVPFEMKAHAKREFGARWDNDERKWWIPQQVANANRERLVDLGYLE